jgi:hypothetical protein
MDFIVELPRSKHGHDCVLTVIDRLSKRVHLIPISGRDGAPQVAKQFFARIVTLHGVPKQIVSDRDSRFIGAFWRELMRLMGTRLAPATSHHPQTDGQVERAIQSVEQALRANGACRQDQWEEDLPYVEFALNSWRNDSTGMTPFEVDLGFQPNAPIDLAIGTSTAVQAVSEFIGHLDDTLRKARASITAAQQAYRDRADRKRAEQHLEVGQKVLLKAESISWPNEPNEPSRKLRPRYIGPFAITRRIGQVAFKLDLPPTMRIHPVFHASNLVPYEERGHANLIPPEETPPPPVSVHGREEYEVESILDERTWHGKHQYLIKWKGWPATDAQWVDETDTHAPSIVQAWRRGRRISDGGGDCQGMECIGIV